MKLAERVALVTGAAQGIGLGIAEVFAEEGASVVLADTQGEKGEEAAARIREHGGRASFVRTDVRDEEQVKALVEAAVAIHGRLDIVVNNAGTARVRSVEESTVAEWDDLMAVNVRSIFLTAKYAVPYMRRQGGGTILNIGSVSSLVGQQGTPCYCASKGAVLMLTRSLALDYGPDGIRANCLCPGITDTPLLRYHAGHADTDPETHLRQRLARVPTAKMLYPRDMGQAAAFLCSPEARGITGTSLVVDGGYLACAEFFP
jgi:NAD(P)-dependent dehydrogenase (short-subunit alcohol dehydrogenase family)